MRGFAVVFTFVSLALASSAVAAPQVEFAERLAGPWGRVDINWQPYSGALSKNTCPAGGVRQPSTIGLFGDGGTIWIEAGPGGSLRVHDGGPLPRTYLFVRLETAASAIYLDGANQKRLALAAADRLSEESLPPNPGVPGAKYLRCKIRK
jgi:hypothetical protein